MFKCYDAKTLARGMQNFGGVAGYFAGKSMLKDMGNAGSVPAATSAAAAVTGAVAPIAANTQAANLGRADLLSTSASGVLGTDPTGRRKVLGGL